ncbi:sugar transferase [Paracraurococcus lichenis]|uniref:Sugar transferase n=1 Tax=Paracraurococcus lichenis TaxID=3064888 RepID=A0ABT9E680_9PROT|nr:sugar transferase [Paracraurococcus sp. LOR1-02]MDO9711669.1 sugar transferase [Paracraurococcus sp. LOR1-02]
MYERWGKRAFDIGAAALLLLATAPLLAMAALAVLGVLGRPVLFRQWRSGRDGRPFRVLKLRSLRAGPGPDAERLGRFGRLLRASAIDELPQLLQVLRGEMSLVGPRPLPVEYLPRFTPAQRRRLRVRPGLCGLAQAEGRNAVPWARRLALDVRYAAAPPTLAGDLAIMLRCAALLLRGRGAAAPGHATMPAFQGRPRRLRPAQDRLTPAARGAVAIRPAPAPAAPRPAPSPAPSAAARAPPRRPADA